MAIDKTELVVAGAGLGYALGGPVGAAFGAGIGLQISGQRAANEAQAEAEARNAAFFEEQAKFFEDATDRELAIFETESDMIIGGQLATFARAGIDISGSALGVIAQTKEQQSREKSAIKAEGEMNVKLARLKAQDASAVADTLSSSSYNDKQAISTALGAAGTALSIGKSPFSKKKTSKSPSSGATVGPDKETSLGTIYNPRRNVKESFFA